MDFVHLDFKGELKKSEWVWVCVSIWLVYQIWLWKWPGIFQWFFSLIITILFPSLRKPNHARMLKMWGWIEWSRRELIGKWTCCLAAVVACRERTCWLQTEVTVLSWWCLRWLCRQNTSDIPCLGSYFCRLLWWFAAIWTFGGTYILQSTFNRHGYLQRSL